MVRGTTAKDGHLPDTQYLEYEAYEPMALAKMKQVADEIRARWDKVEGIAIIQRIGQAASWRQHRALRLLLATSR